MKTSSEPSYEQIRNLAFKLYMASKVFGAKPNPTDEELKLSGFWRKARLILQGKRLPPKYLRREIIGLQKCPTCGNRLISSRLIMECDNCHRIGCMACIGIRTYVDMGDRWESYQAVRKSKRIPLKTLMTLPKKKLCRDCTYILDEL